MSDEPQAEIPSPRPKKPLLPPSRIAFLIFVVIAAVVICLEFRARTAFKKTYQAVDDAMTEGNKTGRAVYKEDVEKLLRGSPRRKPDGSGEVFTWRGVLRRYQMRLEYGQGGFVQRIAAE